MLILSVRMVPWHEESVLERVLFVVFKECERALVKF